MVRGIEVADQIVNAPRDARRQPDRAHRHEGARGRAEALEREAKLRVADPAAARQAVERLGARLVRARHFEDNLLLDDAARTLAGRGCALRLRRADGRAVLTYKGPRLETDDRVKVRPEIESRGG